MVTLEARESGQVRHLSTRRGLRFGLIEDVPDERDRPGLLLFEAPIIALQTYFVPGSARTSTWATSRPARLIGVETIRLGLRADTLTDVRVGRRRCGPPWEAHDVFHLAIPTYDLDEAQHFYVTLLGCKLARRYEDRVTLDFFGDQLVCHLIAAARRAAHDRRDPMYPRHFGVTFRAEADFEALHACAVTRKIPFYQEASTRFEGLVEEHSTFVLMDPSGNLLEFKHYRDPRMMY